MSLVQGTMLFAAELTWSGQRRVEGEYQRAINQVARSTLGAFRSAPQGILVAESGLTPARPLPGYRQSRSAQRLLARPKDGWGPKEILTRERSAITTRLQTASGRRPRESVEVQELCSSRIFPGHIRHRREGTGARDSQKLGAAQHYLDRWLTARQREGRSSMCMAAS